MIAGRLAGPTLIATPAGLAIPPDRVAAQLRVAVSCRVKRCPRLRFTARISLGERDGTAVRHTRRVTARLSETVPASLFCLVGVLPKVVVLRVAS